MLFHVGLCFFTTSNNSSSIYPVYRIGGGLLCRCMDFLFTPKFAGKFGKPFWVSIYVQVQIFMKSYEIILGDYVWFTFSDLNSTQSCKAGWL